VGAEKFRAAFGTLDGEIFDGVFGDAEQPGDVFLGVALDFSEEDHFALAFWEGVDGFSEKG